MKEEWMNHRVEITREEAESKGLVAVADDHKVEMAYSRAGTAMIFIDHTGAPDTLRGRGVGQALMRRGVEDARAEARKIMPLCPFAKARIARHPEWQVVRKD